MVNRAKKNNSEQNMIDNVPSEFGDETKKQKHCVYVYAIHICVECSFF